MRPAPGTLRARVAPSLLRDIAMADVTTTPDQVIANRGFSFRNALTAAEIDLRLLGMLLALAAILFGFNVLSGGTFLRPTNMATLAVQAAGIAILSTGMVLVIVARNIDLSVGSVVGVIAMSYALLMTDWLPNILGMSPTFPFRWVIALLIGAALGAIIGIAAFANASFWPPGAATRYAQEHGITEPAGGLQISVGLPWPVVILITVAVVMTFLATRRRFGRYVYAYGGNPEAAELAGINTRWTVVKIYILMGILCAISAAIAAARLNGATLDVGQSYELYVIAAAVVGGTSFAGGIGTIPGAVLGAFVMQALAYGLAYSGNNSGIENIVAGVVLILAVGFDTYSRRRGGRT